MKTLSRTFLRSATLPSHVTCGPLADSPEKIMQFGEGNFLRAFADWMVDVMNGQGLFNGRVVVVQPIRQGTAGLLNEQEGLYTLLLRGIQDGVTVEQHRLIAAVSRALNPYEAWEQTVRCFCNPSLRFVISNTTEAGIAFVNEARRPGQCPESFPAKVTSLLFERFQAAQGDPARGLIFLPCELVDRNGEQLRRFVLQHGEAWGLGREFADWVSRANYFLNTLVDRIVPGFPRDEAGEIGRKLGYEDRLLVAAEMFHLWVIEGPLHLSEEIPFHQAGLNVVWTKDLTPYRTRKVRILNGAHTASVLAAFLAGLNTVREMLENPVFGQLVRRVVFEEILPTVPLPAQEKTSYASAVLERFANPFVRHELLTISLNSVSKWKVRVLPSLLDYRATQGRLPPLLSFSLAALLHFYRGRRAATGNLTGQRGTESYPIRDEPLVLDAFERAWAEYEEHRSAHRLTTEILVKTQLWGVNLAAIDGLADTVAGALGQIQRIGMAEALQRL